MHYYQCQEVRNLRVCLDSPVLSGGSQSLFYRQQVVEVRAAMTEKTL